jgi:two-component system, LuxR family, sensor kinase FixL
MLDFFSQLFDSESFMPHGHCYLWEPTILWTHIIGDLLTVLAYFSIPIGLFIFIRKRKDLRHQGIFVLFAAFIFLCGITHLIDLWIIWVPTYRLESLAKVITGGISFFTAVALFRAIPQALQIPSVADLEHQKQLLSQGEEISKTSSWIWDTSTGDIQYTEEALRIFELDAATTHAGNYSQRLLDRVHPDDLAAMQEQLDELVKDKLLSSIETRLLMPDGRVKWVRIKAGKWLSDTSLLGATQDITEEKEQELALRSVQKELEEVLFIASHDLQEPLRTIQNYLRLIEEDFEAFLNEDLKHYFNRIHNSAQRMRTLIKDLLEYSLIGKSDSPEPIVLDDLLNDVLQDLQHPIAQAEAKITIDPLPELQAVPSEIKQLFQNILSNALKYRQPSIHPEIKVSAISKNHQWVFAVSDNGIGISPENQQKIFAIFQRLHTKKEYEGTGIGLAHCQKIVQNYRGKIWVESTPSLGSTFFFTLPQAQPHFTQPTDS